LLQVLNIFYIFYEQINSRVRLIVNTFEEKNYVCFVFNGEGNMQYSGMNFCQQSELVLVTV